MAFVSEGHHHHRFCIVTSITITTIVIQSNFCSDTCCLCSEAATDFFSVRTFLGSGAGGPAGWCLTHIQTRPRGSLGAAICETVCETVAICASMPLCPDHRPGACPSAPVPPSPSVRSPLGPRRYLSFFRPFWPSWQRSARCQRSTWGRMGNGTTARGTGELLIGMDTLV